MPGSGVFINYRAEDSQAAAALIDQALTSCFGRDHVFLDSRSIPIGTDFTRELLARLRSSSVLLVVIGPRWLITADEAGRRRIDDPGDWTRLEIANALRWGLRVVPVLLDGTVLPPTQLLPDDIAELCHRQYLSLRLRHTEIDLRIIADRVAETDVGLATIAARRAFRCRCCGAATIKAS